MNLGVIWAGTDDDVSMSPVMEEKAGKIEHRTICQRLVP